MAFFAYSIYDVWDLTFLAKVLPIATSCVALVLCLIGMTILARGDVSNAFIHDGELQWKTSDEGYEQSPFHYVWWILGFMISTWLVGFMISIVLFYFAFMRTKAKTSWWGISLMAGATVAILATISHVFLVDFPSGVLQTYV